MESLVITPWSDFDDLETVYNCIYGVNHSNVYNERDIEWFKYAKNKLTIWLSRNNGTNDWATNASLMATHAILSAFINDNNYVTNDIEITCGDQTAVYSLYALSVIRFCTAITHSDKTIKSVKSLAERYSCPQWIVECRHSLCHLSHNQPSLIQLREASHFGFKWLKRYYWDELVATKSAPDCYALIQSYFATKNNKKLKISIRKEMVSALKAFTNEFIASFVIYMLDNTTKDNCDDSTNSDSQTTIEIKKKYLRKYARIFIKINQNKCLPQLVNRIVHYLDDENAAIRHRSSCWLNVIINAIKTEPKTSKFERTFASVNHVCLMPRIEWIRLLYQIVKRPNEYTTLLIALINPFVNGLICQQKIEKLINLSKLYGKQKWQ